MAHAKLKAPRKRFTLFAQAIGTRKKMIANAEKKI
jgi:hypothetical protein